MNAPPAIERLISQLRRLPGIGEKSATRLTFHILAEDRNQVQALADALLRVQEEVQLCGRCFQLTETNPCNICRDPKRDQHIICVVEEPSDLAAIERCGEFRGLYHVLGGTLAPIEGIGPETLHIRELVQRVKSEPITEVILATNPNAEGDTTAQWVASALKENSVRITRIGSGMPFGGDLEYADQVTVGRSLQHRRNYSASTS